MAQFFDFLFDLLNFVDASGCRVRFVAQFNFGGVGVLKVVVVVVVVTGNSIFALPLTIRVDSKFELPLKSAPSKQKYYFNEFRVHKKITNPIPVSMF